MLDLAIINYLSFVRLIKKIIPFIFHFSRGWAVGERRLCRTSWKSFLDNQIKSSLTIENSWHADNVSRFDHPPFSFPSSSLSVDFLLSLFPPPPFLLLGEGTLRFQLFHPGPGVIKGNQTRKFLAASLSRIMPSETACFKLIDDHVFRRTRSTVEIILRSSARDGFMKWPRFFRQLRLITEPLDSEILVSLDPILHARYTRTRVEYWTVM